MRYAGVPPASERETRAYRSNRRRFLEVVSRTARVEKYFSESEKRQLTGPRLKAFFTKTVTVKVTNSVVMTEATRTTPALARRAVRLRDKASTGANCIRKMRLLV